MWLEPCTAMDVKSLFNLNFNNKPSDVSLFKLLEVIVLLTNQNMGLYFGQFSGHIESVNMCIIICHIMANNYHEMLVEGILERCGMNMEKYCFRTSSRNVLVGNIQWVESRRILQIPTQIFIFRHHPWFLFRTQIMSKQSQTSLHAKKMG